MAAAFNAIVADDRPINVRPWLYRIARNRSLNHLRRTQAIGVDSMDVHLSDHGATTADKVHEREEFRLLVGDIHELPETQQTALVLREMDALSYEQIAEAMETTVSSVKSLLVRARRVAGRGRRGAAAVLRRGPDRAGRGRRGPAPPPQPAGPPPPAVLQALHESSAPSSSRPTRRWRRCCRSARWCVLQKLAVRPSRPLAPARASGAGGDRRRGRRSAAAGRRPQRPAPERPLRWVGAGGIRLGRNRRDRHQGGGRPGRRGAGHRRSGRGLPAADAPLEASPHVTHHTVTPTARRRHPHGPRPLDAHVVADADLPEHGAPQKSSRRSCTPPRRPPRPSRATPPRLIPRPTRRPRRRPTRPRPSRPTRPRQDPTDHHGAGHDHHAGPGRRRPDSDADRPDGAATPGPRRRLRRRRTTAPPDNARRAQRRRRRRRRRRHPGSADDHDAAAATTSRRRRRRRRPRRLRPPAARPARTAPRRPRSARPSPDPPRRRAPRHVTGTAAPRLPVEHEPVAEPRPDRLRPLPRRRHARRPRDRGRGLPRGPQAGLEADDRLRARDRHSSARRPGSPTTRGRSSTDRWSSRSSTFRPRQIGPVRSEVLVLGALDDELDVVLLRPDRDAALGSRIA